MHHSSCALYNQLCQTKQKINLTWYGLTVYAFNRLTQMHGMPTFADIVLRAGSTVRGHRQGLWPRRVCTLVPGDKYTHVCTHVNLGIKDAIKDIKEWYNAVTREGLLQIRWSGRVSLKKWHLSLEFNEKRRQPGNKAGVKCSRQSKQQRPKALKLGELVVMSKAWKDRSSWLSVSLLSKKLFDTCVYIRGETNAGANWIPWLF